MPPARTDQPVSTPNPGRYAPAASPPSPGREAVLGSGTRYQALMTPESAHEEETMPHYLIQAAYTSDAVATLVKHPQDRLDAVRSVIERLGGHVVGKWFAFGDYDVVHIAEMPDAVSAAAFAMAAAAGGALRAIKTTPLMTAEEGLEAMRKAGSAGYEPPR